MFYLRFLIQYMLKSKSADKEVERSRSTSLSARTRTQTQQSPYMDIEKEQWLARLMKEHAMFTVSVRPTKALKKDITFILKDLPRDPVDALQLSLNENNQKVSVIEELKFYFVDHVKLKRDNMPVYGDFFKFMRAFGPNCFLYDNNGRQKQYGVINISYLEDSLDNTHVSCIAIAKSGALHTKSGAKPFTGHFICGFMTLEYVGYTAFLKEHIDEFDFAEKAKHFKDLKDLSPLQDTDWTVYVDLVCSGFGLGGQLLKLLETPKVRKKLSAHFNRPDYAFVSLSSIPSAYMFYASQMGYHRSLNTRRVYPILYIPALKWNYYKRFVDDIKDVFPIYKKSGLLATRGYYIYKVTPLFSSLMGLMDDSEKRPVDYDKDKLYLYTKRLAPPGVLVAPSPLSRRSRTHLKG